MTDRLTQVLRLGTHAEAEYFRNALPCYDQVLLNANLVEATPAACAALVYGLKKPYFIDPYTHAFTAPPRYLCSLGKGKTKATKPKKPFVHLANRYFGEGGDFVGRESLEPGRIYALQLASNVLEYQRTRLKEAVSEPHERAIKESGLLTPTLLIAPYFPLRMKDSTAWIRVNIECLRASQAIDRSVACIISITSDMARSNDMDSVVEQYLQLEPATILLWIESMDEDLADASLLRSYLSLVERLSARGANIVNLFGGFFSCIARDYNLFGFAHGLIYGETRSFTPVGGGGLPPPRFYVKPLHTSMSVLDAEVLLGEITGPEYLTKVCDCAICTQMFSARSPLTGFAQFSEVDQEGKFTPRAYALCRFHFLLARRSEVLDMGGLSASDKRMYLEQNISFIDSLYASDLTEHLHTWLTLIK